MAHRPAHSQQQNRLHRHLYPLHPQCYPRIHTHLLHQRPYTQLHNHARRSPYSLLPIGDLQAPHTVGMDWQLRKLFTEAGLLRHESRALPANIERAKGSRVDAVQQWVAGRLLFAEPEDTYEPCSS